MSKYYKIDNMFSENSSQYIILQYINKNDTVLEFGCASGYMSKYMREKLHCNVFGIDLCQEALNEAKPFLEKDIYANIEDLKWKSEIKDVSFDVIMFADVLEHLKNPEEVLRSAVDFLKPDGKILISIPNIANGDIICKLLSNRFDYTQYGLLDNTHIHFWGSENLIELCDDCGLFLSELDGTVVEFQESEQNAKEPVSEKVIDTIAENPYSLVYQFICKAYKKEYAKNNFMQRIFPINNKVFRIPVTQKSKIFFDCGELSENNSIKVPIIKDRIITGKILLPPSCSAIRFDPIEGSNCIITDFIISSNNGLLNYEWGNFSSEINGNYCFFTNDPQFYIPCPISTAWVEISCSIIVVNNIFEQKAVFDFLKTIDLKTNENNSLVEKYCTEITVLKNNFENERQRLRNENNSLVAQHEGEITLLKKDFESEKQRLQNENNSLVAQHEGEISLLKKDFESEKQRLQNENSSLVAQHEDEIAVLKSDFENEKQRLQEKSIFLVTQYESEIFTLKTDMNNIISEYKDNIEKLKENLEITVKERDDYASSKANIQQELENTRNFAVVIQGQLVHKEQIIADIQNSFSWKITRPLCNFKRFVIHHMDKHSFTLKIRKALSVWRHKGFKEMIRAYKRYKIKKKTVYSPEITEASAVQKDNKTGYLPYDSEYQEDRNFSEFETPDVKLLAFYLPQYHTFPENDEWWGKGFTEWTNVKTGSPQFEGHYQPRVPHKDIEYYDLTNISVLKSQVELAKRHGIYGFCFYYYWFSGKRLMEKPVDMLLDHPEIDFPFCLCWANENWTRAWDGQDKEVLIKQDYSDNDDEQFILDLKKYIDDPRYIRIDKKPLIVVYNPGHIPNPHKSFQKWRECAVESGIGDILIWTCQTANNNADILNITDCIDAEVEFPPHNIWIESLAVRNLDLGGKSAFIYNYQCLVKYMEEKLKSDVKPSVPIHHSFMMAWDNQARRKNNWFTFYAFSIHSLYRWILAIINRTRKDFSEEERFIFVNAWNEWGEGTYLEPDEKYGYANINTVSKAIYGLPFYDDLKFMSKYSPVSENAALKVKGKPKIAVQIHAFYMDIIDEIIEELNNIPYPFDCHISTDTEDKREHLLSKFKNECNCRNVYVKIFPNRGRDVSPFLAQLNPVIDDYKYICHIHTKKTLTGDYGDDWRKYNFRHLFGCVEYLKRVFTLFEQNEKLGIIFPETYPVLELQAEWGGNREGVANLLKKLNCDTELPADAIFPVGNMFWARTAAIREIFKINLKSEDFPEEAGQVNATLAHVIERTWVYLAKAFGYSYCKIFNNFSVSNGALLNNKKRLCIYVHYDKNNVISKDDIETVKDLCNISQNLIFVTNSNIDKNEMAKVKSLAIKVIKRDNMGFDFGGWRDALLDLGVKRAKKYDELILANNSFFRPIFDLKNMLAEMEIRNLDFWGNTIFPYSPDGSYISRDCIHEHLQSYFLVFNQSVIKSDVFWKFWKNVQNHTTLIDVIANCESQLTKILSDAGFSYAPYIHETYYISKYLNNYAIPYEKPTSLLLLGSPFVKKKCYFSMNDEEKSRMEWFKNNI